MSTEAVPTPNNRGGITLIADAAVRHLFGITLELSSTLEVNRDGEVGQRIRKIIGHTDDLIQEFRLVALEATPPPSDGPVEVSPTNGGVPKSRPHPGFEPSRAVGLLREASAAIERSLAFAHGQFQTRAPLELELEEASWAVHRALVALTG